VTWGNGGVTGPRAADRAAGWFAECYGGQPEGVWHAPGRVNLIGEHTDYNEGFVLPFALAQGVRAAASRREDGLLDLHSRQVPASPATAPLSKLAPGSVAGWAAYPAGAAWALREAGYPVEGTSIAIDADLERGAALSSSAALECAAALALTELHGLSVERPRLAALARRAENEFVGVPTGIMDQSASLLCRAGHALLLDCRSGQASDVPLDLAAAGLVLLVIDTRVQHALADGRYAARRRACEDAARVLGVPSLRDVTDRPGAVEQIADPLLRRRARHVVAVEAAAAGGALGARMTGGGFGGSVIALVEAEQAAGVRSSASGAFADHGWPPPRFLEAQPSDGARRLR
jgi:galactokinase